MTLKEKEEIIKSYMYDITNKQKNFTTAELQEKIHQKYPKIKFLDVSRVLYKEKIPYEDTPLGRAYIAPDDLYTSMVNYINSTPTFTKSEFRRAMKTNSCYDETRFDQNFFVLGLVHTGEYNKENHKIYTSVPEGKHYSQTGKELVSLSDMHPNHTFNALMKKYKHTDLEDCFKVESEVYKLLKAYFTFDIRTELKKLVDGTI